MDDESWKEPIVARYPDWGTERWEAMWRDREPPAAIGQEVEGEVISRAPFGVWVEAGLGTPALLLAPTMAGPPRPGDYPAIGARLSARVNAVTPKGEIGLTQRPADSGS